MQRDLPELEEVYREGKVCLANAPGIADDKVGFSYVPDMIRHYLGEEPVLRNAPTHSLIGPEHRDETLSRLDELVLKPRKGCGEHGLTVGPEAEERDVNRAREHAREAEEAYIDLRAFVLPAADYVMPGGLTRVANPGTRVANSSAGGRVKDTWVLEVR